MLRSRNFSHIKIAKALSKELNAPIAGNINDYYDIVIAVDSTSDYVKPLAIAKLKGVLTSAFIHDIRSISHTKIAALDAGTNPLIQRLKRVLSLNIVKHLIDKALTPSKASAGNLRTYARIEACIVPLGVDRRIYRPIKLEERSILGIRFSKDDRLILTVATKRHIVRHSLAIFYEVRKELRNAKLIVRGPCDVIPRGIKDVLCLPPISEKIMPRLYSVADVFLYPSLIEGFGLPVLEAMACGLPVVAYNEEAVSEVLGDAGILIESGDIKNAAVAVIKALNNRELYSELGIKRAEKFTWQNTATAIRQCLNL